MGGEGDDRGWDGWIASLTRWTWVWVNSGSWWWTERPSMLRSMGSQRIRHDWVTELNWTELNLFWRCRQTSRTIRKWSLKRKTDDKVYFGKLLGDQREHNRVSKLSDELSNEFSILLSCFCGLPCKMKRVCGTLTYLRVNMVVNQRTLLRVRTL